MSVARQAITTPIGDLFVLSRDDVLVAADFVAERIQARVSRHLRDVLILNGSGNGFIQQSFEAYFQGEPDALAGVATHTRGTPFQERVWSALRHIPLGRTVCYSELAGIIGLPKAVRAVARANSMNPVAIVIPCHRVIGKTGRLTGYAGGLARKGWLLEHECRMARLELELERLA